jgi:xylulokinase/glycerol kinase
LLLCGGDQQCAALALGLFAPGTATANTGTGSFVLGYADKPTFDREQRILCSASAIPGRWIVEAGIYASGAMYNWARKAAF